MCITYIHHHITRYGIASDTHRTNRVLMYVMMELAHSS